jgi:DNA polymerase sigma
MDSRSSNRRKKGAGGSQGGGNIEDLIAFNKLAVGGHVQARSALREYETTQNKDVFNRKISEILATEKLNPTPMPAPLAAPPSAPNTIVSVESLESEKTSVEINNSSVPVPHIPQMQAPNRSQSQPIASVFGLRPGVGVGVGGFPGSMSVPSAHTMSGIPGPTGQILSTPMIGQNQSQQYLMQQRQQQMQGLSPQMQQHQHLQQQKQHQQKMQIQRQQLLQQQQHRKATSVMPNPNSNKSESKGQIESLPSKSSATMNTSSIPMPMSTSPPNVMSKVGNGRDALQAFLRGGSTSASKIGNTNMRISSNNHSKSMGNPHKSQLEETIAPLSSLVGSMNLGARSLLNNPRTTDNHDNEKSKPKPRLPIRSTAICKSFIGYSDSSRLRYSPNDRMQVRWQHVVDPNKYSGAMRLSIALQRFGSGSNTQCIVTKHARGGANDFKGHVVFTAPKSAGIFVYRLFDDSTPETAVETLAASPAFHVCLTGKDLGNSLRVALDSFKKGGIECPGFVQLKSTLEGLVGVQGLDRSGIIETSTLLQSCVGYIFRKVMKSYEEYTTLNEEDAIMKQKSNEDTNNDMNKDKAISTKYRKLARVHLDAYDALQALQNNKVVLENLIIPVEMLTQAKQMIELFSDITLRFYDTKQNMIDDIFDKLKFTYGIKKVDITQELVDELTESITQKLPSLIPSTDFDTTREDTRARIEKQLLECKAIPEGATLHIFGSSRNSFGSEGADLDMCLQLNATWTEVKAEEKEKIINDVADVLTSMNMQDIESRSTARIPIVMFVDPITGLHCDISCNNPLAIRNTALLCAYGAVDPRVRELAFIIKHWAKRRQINSPQFSTLSSYGYLLCLIHFLQTRSPPVVPNLQALSHTWEPADSPGFEIPLVQGRILPEMEKFRLQIGERAPIFPYFYDPSKDDTSAMKVRSFASQNRQSTGELLIGFFEYYAWQFDYRNVVVSINSLGRDYSNVEIDPTAPKTMKGSVPRLVKQERDCWPPATRLSIEDPFETWYDVGHVIRGPQMGVMRKEFIRAHSLITRTIHPIDVDDDLPSFVDRNDLLDIICEEAEPPVMIKKPRSDTIISETAEDN